MTQALHTPGPWTHGNSDKPVSMIAVCFDGGTIARFPESGDISFDETMANARLITAAPELLAALQSMVEIAELTIGWLPTPPNADGPLIQARAAIAKATWNAT